ncbi:bifunctional [glutamate--ammonia ligase]-adenylyl-L-tyrosine phosphorylase/[glutamate--ammonia-ligase] adenylyltransferase [Alteromonas sp. C1M14]|uniref:bifunctional [glutamate--ammonia ligase]-adenylyl-L-tyrosine phosphorylase/[glutamate--ammonia-ligase] adenylyltransferase n=1 Tax=Alteromonas sp. C1M14 TaxID=2841567 RepID=UPI001C0A4707|nr:bifunctional [glutamate--ammonia ligase]-adenylyl-L-tyrosine phosphorylase/[glutamate--ammonia-ligase] adenylyltransferase [Alteromonas sp. C1M14]MBU2979226.1 bifunctional [glutamate--ammonia ligase]-adenylyl-L-tyrosine phosphorylase/[glutamate--ammonia-ligase] adenylyltransferase [Alteromonas sp. C1M14]
MPTTEIKNRIIKQKGEAYWAELIATHPSLNRFTEQQDNFVEILGSSEFLFRQFLQHPQWFESCICDTHLPVTTEAYQAKLLPTLTGTDESRLHNELRLFRHEYMVRIAWQDLSGQQSVATSLVQVSALADALIMGAYETLYHQHCLQYGTPQGEHGPQPMLILGMGKLGGKELNFSSDIDLIFVYPAKGETDRERKPLENQQFFIRLAQKLISALNKITVDGQVFRVDMRLRPFGESGPLVMHMSSFEDYYQEQGRHWERFAMVKARVLNPPSPYREMIENILKPFTFRRYLDFTTIDSLREMKQLIASEQRRRQLKGNIKLGTGGIREVEFFAQSFQLIHGGREPALQVKGLKETLDAIHALDLASGEEINTLYDGYLFLRKAEHTLQQMNDEQTQLLPETPFQQQVLANALGYADYHQFTTALQQVMQTIHEMFRDVIDTTEDSHDDDDTVFNRCCDAWHLSLEEDEFNALLSPPITAADSRIIFQRLYDFKDKLTHTRLGQRGADTLNKLMPEVLYQLVEQNPDKTRQTLTRLLNVIYAITGRTTYLDLLLENPDVLKQLIKLCDRSEWIAEQIQRFPLLLDELLTPLYLQQQNTNINQSRENYQDELRQALLRIEPQDVELVMDAWRQFRLCQQLRIAASDISGSLPINCVSDKLTALAEVIIESVLTHAWQQMLEKYGKPSHLTDESTGFAVIGYGKLGGYELGYGSDLDLVFVHNAPRDSTTDGKRQLGAAQFYIKLAQRMMHLLNTKTLFGQLYETDLRLRPSGNAGLLCCHIDGYEKYQREDAWTWEHQALVRARGITGERALLDQFQCIRKQILCAPRDINTLRQDVSAMREKMRTHLLSNTDNGVDLKQCSGGITDIEFMAQYWVLSWAEKHPQITVYPDNLRILEEAEKLEIIDTSDAKTLQSAYLTLRNHYHQLTLADHRFADHSEELDATRLAVSQIWQRIITSPNPPSP